MWGSSTPTGSMVPRQYTDDADCVAHPTQILRATDHDIDFRKARASSIFFMSGRNG